MRAVLLNQGKALAVLVRIENGHSGGERNFAHAFAENFSLQLHTAANGIVLNVQVYVGMLDGVRKRGDVRVLGRLGREFHELVVFVESQRDIPRNRARAEWISLPPRTRSKAVTLRKCFSSHTCLFVTLKVELRGGKLILAGEFGNKKYRRTKRGERNIDRQNAGYLSRG